MPDTKNTNIALTLEQLQEHHQKRNNGKVTVRLANLSVGKPNSANLQNNITRLTEQTTVTLR